MRKEYDFSKGVRGKYAKKFKAGTNLVKLDPDMARVFKTSASVNKALRLLVKSSEKNSGSQIKRLAK